MTAWQETVEDGALYLDRNRYVWQAVLNATELMLVENPDGTTALEHALSEDADAVARDFGPMARLSASYPIRHRGGPEDSA